MNCSPLVTVVIVNWNGYRDTLKCIESLLNLSYKNLQIVVVDNGSKLDEAEMFKKLYRHEVHSIHITQNGGYSAGLNQGVRYALEKFPDTKYFLLSNNDVTFQKDFLDRIIRFLDVNENCGIATGKILLMDQKDIIYSIGQKWSLRTGKVENLGYGERKTNVPTKPFEIDFIPGTVFAVKATLLHKIGLLDEDYFLYFEETDYCMRAIKAGFKSYLVPNAEAYHKSRASISKINLLAYSFFQKSRFRFIIKHIDSNWLLATLTLASFDTLLNSFGSSIKRRDPLFLYYAIEAICSNIRQAPGTRLLFISKPKGK